MKDINSNWNSNKTNITKEHQRQTSNENIFIPVIQYLLHAEPPDMFQTELQVQMKMSALVKGSYIPKITSERGKHHFKESNWRKYKRNRKSRNYKKGKRKIAQA